MAAVLLVGFEGFSARFTWTFHHFYIIISPTANWPRMRAEARSRVFVIELFTVVVVIVHTMLFQMGFLLKRIVLQVLQNYAVTDI